MLFLQFGCRYAIYRVFHDLSRIYVPYLIYFFSNFSTFQHHITIVGVSDLVFLT